MGKSDQGAVIVGGVQQTRHEIIQIKILRIHILLQIHQLAGISEYPKASDLHLSDHRGLLGGQSRLHLGAGLGVGALLHCLHIDLVLGLVEGLRNPFNQLSVGGAHAVPEFDLNLLIRLRLSALPGGSRLLCAGSASRQSQDRHTCE